MKSYDPPPLATRRPRNENSPATTRTSMFWQSAPSCIALFLALAAFCFPVSAHAEINFILSLTRSSTVYYPWITLTSDPAPESVHRVESADGSLWRQTGTNFEGNEFFFTNDVSTIVHTVTNGPWKLYLNKGTAEESIYYFTISMAGVNSDQFGVVEILYPVQSSAGVPPQPTFHWTGPSHLTYLYVSASDNDFLRSFSTDEISTTTTNWTPPGALLPGDNQFQVSYGAYPFAGITISTPTNSLGQPLANWTAQGDIISTAFSFFTVTGQSSQGGHVLAAHYEFEDGSIHTEDLSPADNDIQFGSSFGGAVAIVTNDAASGELALGLDTNEGNGAAWLTTADELLGTVAGSFSVSVRVKTDQIWGSDDDDGLFGNAGIVSAFNGAGSAWVVPMSIAGSKLAFVTGGSSGWNTLRSQTDINTGDFVHLVVTRDQITGEKRIYINGQLDAQGFGTTELLDEAEALDIGYNNGEGLHGVLDDIQIYSGVLSDSEVEFLFQNPGQTVPDVVGNNLGEAVDAPNLSWNTSITSPWFLQTDMTSDGVDAAQSGAIGDDEESWMETTVHGPGTLSFYWAVSSEEDADFLELYIDDSWQSAISGDSGWTFEAFEIDPGPHTIRWRYVKDGVSADFADAGYVDDVIFTAQLPPITFSITVVQEKRALHDDFFPGLTTYVAFPNLSSSFEPLSYHFLESPTAAFQGSFGPTNMSSSVIFTNFNDMLHSLTNGVWTLWLDKDSAQEQSFQFEVSTDSLTTNTFATVNITVPQNGSTMVSTNPAYAWTGPADWEELHVRAWRRTNDMNVNYAFGNLAPAATTWVSGPAVLPGTNFFSVRYERTMDIFDVTIPFLEFSTGESRVTTEAVSGFIVGSPQSQQPIVLLPQNAGTNLQISFASQIGATHVILSRTNLGVGVWRTNQVIAGDGTLKNFSVPKTNAQHFFRLHTY